MSEKMLVNFRSPVDLVSRFDQTCGENNISRTGKLNQLMQNYVQGHAKSVWEILVPTISRTGKTFTYEHHKEWDAYVRKISGGVTIHRPAKGEWVNDNEVLVTERVIPCRLICSRVWMDEIVDFTLLHYDQDAVRAFAIAETFILKRREEL